MNPMLKLICDGIAFVSFVTLFISGCCWISKIHNEMLSTDIEKDVK